MNTSVDRLFFVFNLKKQNVMCIMPNILIYRGDNLGVELIPFSVFLVYHLVNIYTDVKYRVTKNIWHLAFLIIGLGYYYGYANSSPWYKPVATMVLTLGIGLILEYLKQSSPGDTKMLVITSLLISLTLPYQGYIRIAAAVIIFHLAILAIIAYFKLFQKHGVLQTFKYQFSDIKAFFTPGIPISKEVIFDHFPGAITIMLGSVMYTLISFLLDLR